MTGQSAACAMRRRRPTASASRQAGRVCGWDAGDSSPAAFFSAIMASITPAFSQWTPHTPPSRRMAFSALYTAPSPIIMAG